MRKRPAYEPLFYLTRAQIAKKLKIDARTLSKYFDRERIPADAYLDQDNFLLVLYDWSRLPEFKAQLSKYLDFNQNIEADQTNES